VHHGLVSSPLASTMATSTKRKARRSSKRAAGEHHADALAVAPHAPFPKPYHAYLVFNLAKDTSTPRTEIRVHQDPCAATHVRNELLPPSTSCWTVVETVGPFTTKKAALEYADLWSMRTRRPMWLAAKGLVLGRHLDRVQNRRPQDDMAVPLRLEVTAVPAREHQKRLQRRHSVYEPSRRPFAGLLMDGTSPALPPRPSQIQLHDVQQGWLRRDAFY
jgi:hypothetical protein